jgi:ribosomal protein S18 acetylase RimI-like enzyme
MVEVGSYRRWPRLRRAIVIFWTADLARVPAKPEDHQLRRVSWEEVCPGDGTTLLHLAQATQLPASEVAERLVRGADWVGLVVDGQIAATGWVSRAPAFVGEAGCWFAPLAGQAYIWDCVTRPRFRGQHRYPLLLQELGEHLAAEGVRNAWLGVEWHNWKSIAGVIHAGFRPVGAIVALRVAGWCWHGLEINPSADLTVVRWLRAQLRQRAPAGAPTGLTGGDHPQGLPGAGRRDRLLAPDRRSLERPGAGPVDPNQGQAA